MNAIRSLWRDNKGFLLFLFLMFAFRSSVADWNTVPTGSMKPTIVEGDRILVNKLAYDLQVPFTQISLLHLSDPQRGDIVIFESAVSDNRLVKRVIGIPGDIVHLIDNKLTINSQPLRYTEISATPRVVEMREHLRGAEHPVWVSRVGSRLDSFGPVVVPQNHYLVLGDNRDNSADSRSIGFVPRHEIVGRSRRVVISLDYGNFYLPRSERFLRRLDG